MKRGYLSCSLLFLLSVVYAEQPNGNKTKQPEETGLQGTWSVLVFEREGFWLTTDLTGAYYRNLMVRITDKTITLRSQDKSIPAPLSLELMWDDAYQIRPKKKPKEIDLTQLLWSSLGKWVESDKIRRGIYELQGDRLVICINDSSKSKRPVGFKCSPGASNIILLLQRVKK